MGNTPAILQLSRVTKGYAGVRGDASVAVLREISLEIPAGDSVAIIGPSGSGKSTLLNVMGTLDKPDSGEIQLAGQDITRLDEGSLAALRNRQIGWIFQAHHLLPHCTVLENVLVPTLPAKDMELRRSADTRARELLDRVRLGHRLHHRPGQLSGGERQRAAVVRALINQPKLLLADEPTGSLDRVSAAELGQLLVELNREQSVSLVVVTHALELARRMARVFDLRDGRLVQESTGAVA